ncbi:MAG: NAD(P)/FAD-dependent oxidoreductase [bacterium]
MTKRYDAVVVGAGLGGLSAATAMARAGLGVCLLERHNIPGGYATSFVRGRFEFEVALHELSGIGAAGEATKLDAFLDHLGVSAEVEIVRVPELYRSIFPDLDVVLPSGWDSYEATLCELFPREADGLHRFLGRVQKVGREVQEITRHYNFGNPLTAPTRFPNVIRYLPATWGQLLDHDIRDPRARAVLSQYWGYFGMGPSRVSGLYFAVALDAYVRLGPSYVKGRSQALSNAFVRAFERHGGDVRFNCGVRSITTDGGHVSGVITEQGEPIEAPFVVSNADPITTCRELLAEGEVGRRFFDSMRHRTVAPSSVNVYLGLACPREELGELVHENFVNSDYDMDSHYERFSSLVDPAVTLVTCYSSVVPEISPPGTTMLVLTTLMYGDPWMRIPPEEYVDTKNRVAESMLRDAERLAPGLRDHIEELEVATPITNMRYTGALGGSIYGFNSPAFDHTILRMPPRGPVPGLFFAGAWTQPGGGFEPCMMSGKIAARAVRAQLEKGGRS